MFNVLYFYRKGEHDDSYQPGSTVEDDGYGSAMPSTGSQSPTDKPSKHKKQQKTYFNFDEPDESEGSVELKTIHLKNDGKMKSKGGKTTDTLTFSDSDDDESDKKKNSKSKTEILRKNQKNADISTDVDDSDMIEIEAKAKKRKAKKVRTDDKIMDKELKLRENFDITTKTTSDSDSEANEKEGDKKRSVNSNSSIRNVTLKMANDDTSHGTDESEKTKSIGKKENRKYTDVSELIESHLTIGKPNKDKRKRVESDHKIKGKKLKRKSVTADALSRSDSDSSGNKSKSEEFPETEIGDATSDEMNSIDSDDSEANRKSIGKPTCKRESKNLKTESVSCDIDRVHAVAGSIEKLKTKPTKDFIKRVVKSEKQTVLNEVSAYVVCEGATKKGDKDQESKLPRGTKRKTSELLDMTPKISKKRKMADKEETSSDVNLIEDELFEYAMQTNSKKRKLDNTASINDHTDANETTSSSSKRKRQKKDDICASKSDIQNEVFEVVKESSKKSNRRKKGDILDQTQNRIPVGYSESCNVDDVLTVELPREEVKKESKKSRKERGDEGKKKKGNKKKRRDDKKKKRKDDKKKKRKDGERKKKDSGKKRRHCDKKKKDREKDSQKKKKRG